MRPGQHVRVATSEEVPTLTVKIEDLGEPGSADQMAVTPVACGPLAPWVTV